MSNPFEKKEDKDTGKGKAIGIGWGLATGGLSDLVQQGDKGLPSILSGGVDPAIQPLGNVPLKNESNTIAPLPVTPSVPAAPKKSLADEAGPKMQEEEEKTTKKAGKGEAANMLSRMGFGIGSPRTARSILLGA